MSNIQKILYKNINSTSVLIRYDLLTNKWIQTAAQLFVMLFRSNAWSTNGDRIQSQHQSILSFVKDQNVLCIHQSAISQYLIPLSWSRSDSEIWHYTVSVNLMLIQFRPSWTLPFYIVRLLTVCPYKQFYINATDDSDGHAAYSLWGNNYKNKYSGACSCCA